MSERMPPLTGSPVTRDADAGERSRNWRRNLLTAPRRFLGLFLYLWMMYGLFLLHESVVLARYNIAFTRWGVGVASAFVLAKVMLVLDELDIARGLRNRPAIYAIALESVVYAVVFLAFYTAEEVCLGLWRGKTALESIPSIGGGTPQGVLASWVIVSFALVPYFTFRELGRALGEKELRALLFTRGRGTSASAGHQ